MSEKETKHKILLSIYHYFCFFIIMAFLITCCMTLFVTTMSKSMNIEFTEENINTAAVLTFWNVVFLSLLFTVIDTVRRKIMIYRPVKKIVDAAEQITKGDYSVRIEPLKNVNRADGLDKIIDCYNKMATELSGTESLKSDFIANVSHELKTPLSVIQNYGTLLQSNNISDDDRIKYSSAIVDASRRLADLISNILKLNKLENQQIYPSAQKFELGEQLCECLLSFESVWDKKEIEIETDIEENVFVNADIELLSIVWNNLISNALKFTDNGGKVLISLKNENGFAAVKISDTGCGITPDIGKHIFEKFYQGDTSHKTEGNGLGLALVRRVIDITEGEIEVESSPCAGTIFTVKLRSINNERSKEDS